MDMQHQCVLLKTLYRRNRLSIKDILVISSLAMGQTCLRQFGHIERKNDKNCIGKYRSLEIDGRRLWKTYNQLDDDDLFLWYG